MLDVLAIGELNPDLILSGFAASGPVIGTEQSYESETLTLGSSTAIACVLMQRLGLKTGLATLIGDDEHGRFCRSALAAEGVETGAVVTDPKLATGITISLSYATDRMLLTRYGTMQAFGGGHVDPATVKAARHLHVGSFFIQTALQPDLPAIFAEARGRGQTTSLDLGWDPSETWDTDILQTLLPHVSIIFPNRVELAGVTGTQDVPTGLRRLHDMGAERIALKLGSQGAIWSDAAGQHHDAGFRVDVVDTTGAGDAFNAGCVAQFLNGAAPKDCLRWGNACGALTASAIGGTGGFRSASEVAQHFNL